MDCEMFECVYARQLVFVSSRTDAGGISISSGWVVVLMTRRVPARCAQPSHPCPRCAAVLLASALLACAGAP